MFTTLLALLTICSCVVGPPDFDADLGQMADVFAADGKFISIILSVSLPIVNTCRPWTEFITSKLLFCEYLIFTFYVKLYFRQCIV